MFFCLAITTVLAQVVTTNIATPNSSGLSDNQVVSFDVNSDGTILNNSASDGTAQLGATAVTGNNNITAGSEADLILLQVTGTSGSDLDGAIEVFGTEAGLIIANPNGITCAGCSFINTDRVDLVTGTYNIATGTYSISDNDFTVDTGGLLANTVGVLNIQTNNFTNNGGYPGVSADTFNLSVAGDFISTGTFSHINVNTFNLSVAGDFNQRQYSEIQANTFNLSVAGDFDYLANYINNTFLTNSAGRITVNAFNLNVGGDFTFSKSANNFIWRENNILTVSGSANITAASFNNSGTIDVDNSFNAIVDSFINKAGATISAFGECNIVSNSYIDNGTITCQDFAGDAEVIDIATPNSNGLSDNQVDDFDVNTYGTILNNSASDGTAQLGGTAVTGNNNITAGSEADLILFQVTGITDSSLDGTIEVFGTEAGIIIANPNGIRCGGCGFINADRVDLVTGTYNIATETYSISDNDFTVNNGGLLANTVGVLNIQTNNFNNNSYYPGVGVSADTFNLSLAGDFNTFVSSEIIVNTFNLSLAGDFNPGQYSEIYANTFNLSLAGDFDYIVNYRVEHNLFLTNSDGRINVNAFNLNVGGDFTFSESANNFIWRENDTLTVSGSANITAASFNNSGNIDVDNSFNATVGTFINETGATITSPGGCNVVYTTSYTDNGTSNCISSIVDDVMVIDIATPNSNGLSDNQVDDFDVHTYGTILNNSAGDGTAQLGGTAVTGNNNITAGSEADLILFQVTGSSVSDLDGTIEVFGTEAGLIIANPNGIACAGCGFINADRVDLVTGTYNIATGTYSISDNDFTVNTGGLLANTVGLLANTVGVLNIQTNNFTSQGGSGIDISADTFNLSVAGDFTIGYDTIINVNTFNLSVTGDFTTGNTSRIDADTFNLSLAGDFAPGQYSDIIANTFNFSLAGDFDKIVSYDAENDIFDTTNNGRITVNAFNFNVDGDFTFSESANNFTWRENDILTVSGTANITAASFNNSGNIDVDNSFNATLGTFINESGATIIAPGGCNVVATTSYTDNGTSNCLTSIVDDTIVIDIATPNSNGLSDNQVDDFDVNTYGTILNNSAGDGTAQLGGTAVTGNNNITAGSEADLILFQVTGTSGSDLDGTIEVLGGEAGIIIANPNGIACAGCSFINTDRVDLVTGTYNIATGTYSISDNDFTVNTGGLLANTVGVLNIQTNNFNNNETFPAGVSADTFNLSVAGDFNNASLNVNTFNLSLAGDFNQRQYVAIQANTFNLSVAGDFDDIVNYINTEFFTTNNGRITTNAFNLTVGGDFTFSKSANNFIWRENDTLTVSGTANITAASFNNSGNIDVDNSFNATVDSFINKAGATISAFGNCNIVSNSYTDNGTINCQDFVADTEVIDIATPFNGLSDNQVDDFDVNAEGTILNNSASDGTAQLRDTAVTGNNNITAGSEADLILFQVTGSTVSDLDGTIEVFGTEAGVIIANPNGITCAGCGFINTNRVDLVTGTYNIATETYSISDNDFTVNSGGLLANTVGVLNIQTNNFTNNDNNLGVSADTFNLSVAGDFINGGDYGIEVNTFNLSLAGDFNHRDNARIVGNTFTLSLAGDFGDIVEYRNDIFFTNNGGLIKVNAFNLNVGGDFTFSESANNFIWRENDTLTVSGTANITANNLSNNGDISANTLSLSVAGDFNYASDFLGNGNINATNQSITARNGNFTNNTSIVLAGDFGVTANNFINTGGSITADTFTLSVAGDFDYASDFLGNGNINATNKSITARNGNFTNNTSIVLAGDFGVTANNFINTGGSITADTFTLSVAGDFDYASDFLGNGTITTNALNLNVGGDFSNNDAANDFTWGENDTLTVLGSASVVADSFSNSGTIAVSNSSFDITATDFTNSGTISANTTLNTTVSIAVSGSFDNTGGVLNSDTFALSVAGDFDYVAEYLDNGTITTNTLNLNVGGNFSFSESANNFNWGDNDILTVSGSASFNLYDFFNRGRIDVANDFNVIAGDDFLNTQNATISADNFNITVGDRFSNYSNATINANNFTVTVEGDFYNIDSATINANDFNVTANNFFNTDELIGDGNISADSFSLSVAEDFDYVADYLNNGTITTNTLNLNVGGDFSNNDANNDFTWDANDSLTVLGSASVVAASFNNSGNINAYSFNVTATDFTNSGTISANTTLNTTVSSTTNNSFTNTGGVLNADTFALSVAGDFDYVADYLNNGTITTNTINLNVGGNFSNNDANNDFTWGVNDALTVSGSASVITDSFNNSGNINADSFNVTAIDFTNSGTISANTTLNTTVSSTANNSFTNTGGVLNADTFALSVAGNFDYSSGFLNNGTITTNALNLNVGGNFSFSESANNFNWGDNDILTVSGSASFNLYDFFNRGRIDVANDFNVIAGDDFLNTQNATISADNFNVTVGDRFSNYYNATINANNFTVTAGDDFFNYETINANDFNVTAESVFLNRDGATINADNFNVEARYRFYNRGGATINADNFNVITENNFYNIDSATINADSFNVSAEGDFYNIDSATINANDFNVTAGDDFYNTYSATVDANNFNVTVEGDFYNIDSATINANDFNLTANNFFNTDDGNISADSFSLSVAGDFDYVANYLNNGTITINAFNLNVGGDFSNNDLANDFTWGVNDTLTVLGTASVVAASFSNSGNINADSFNVTATDFTNSGTISANTTLNTTVSSTANNSFTNTGGVLNADIFALSVAGDFDYVADFNGTITTNTLNLNVGGDFSNNDANNDFTWGANDSLTVLGTASVTTDSFNNSGNINADSFNVTATDFTNSGTISANTTLNTTVSSTANNSFTNTGGVLNADIFALSVAGDFDYVADFNGTITTNTINLNVGGDFSNNDANNDFTWGANDSLTVLGTASVTTDSFNNSGNINADSFNVTATDFTNSGTISANTTLNTTVSSTANNSFTNTGGVLNSNTFALSVAGDFDYVADYLGNGTITTNTLNLNVGGDFSNNDANNDFTWGANDSLTVLGSADIITDSFNNSGNINADSFNVTAKDFTNRGTISANTTLNTTVSSTANNSFTNTGGVLNSDTFALSVAGDFDYVADFNGTITTNTLNLNVGGDFSNNDANNNFTWGANDSLTVLGTASVVAASFNNSGTITADSFNVTAKDFTNSGTISANTTLNTTVSSIANNSFTNTGGVVSADIFALSVAGDFDYVADFNGTITTNTLNLNVGGDFSNNDANNDFTWGANDTLTVLGSADITTDSFNNSGNINADSFNVTATDFTNSGTISANTTLNTTVSSTVSGSFDNTGGVLNSNTFALSVAGDFDYVADFNGTITTNAFNLNVGGDFSNNDANNDFTWGANDSLTVLGTASVTTDSFNNSGNINADSFNVTATDFDNTGGVLNSNTFALSVAGDFDYVADYLNNGTITTNAFNLNVGGDFSNNDANNDFTWGANDALTVLGTASVTTDSFNNSGNINADSFNVTATDFTNSGTISANTTLNTTVSSTTNNSFTNTGGVLNSDTFALSVAGDFDYVADYLNNGTITTNTLNLNVGGDFSNNDANNDFTWGANDALTVLGSASVVAASFSNSGNINADSFNVTATDFTNSGTISANTTLNTTVSSTANNSFTNTGGVLNSNTFALSVAGDFDYVADFNGTITTNTLNLNVGGDFSNNDANNDFTWGANDSLTVVGTASVTTDSFNNSGTIAVSNSSFDITATDFTNSGTISANTTLNTTVSNTVSGSFDNTGGVLNSDTFALSVAGDFDYVADFNGTITTNTINLNVGGDFSNNDAANDFTWGAQNSLTVLGNASVVADSFSNSGNINANSFDITATDFTNSGTISANTTLNTTVSSTVSGSFDNTGGVVSADIFALSVAGDFDYVADFNGTITTNTLNLNVGGDFSNNDANNDFTWGANDALTVLGSADITTASFNNSGTIAVSNSSFDITATDFTNSGTISANTTLNTTVSSTTNNSFTNTGGVLNSDTFALSVAGDFDYVADYLNNGTITTNAFNLNVGGDFSNNDLANDFTWGVNDALTVSGSASVTTDSFNNSGNINADSFNVTATDFTNSGTISANTTLNTTVSSTTNNSFTNTGGVLNSNTFALSVAGDFDYVADYLNNGTITTNAFNLNVGGDFSNNDLANDFTWGVNDALTVSGSASVTTDSFNNSGNINADSFNVTATDFTNSGTISANTTLNTTVSSTVSGSFDNTGGVLNSDTFALSVAGDFDYVADFNGTITADTINLNVGGDFSNNDAANDFTWGAQNSLTVLGNASVVADSFSNSGNINANSFDITATDFTNSGTISANTTLNTTVSSTVSGSFNNIEGVLNADTFNLSVAGDFDYVAEYLNNGTITTNAFNLNVGGDFSNNDSANDFTWGANDSLTVLGSASVTTDSFNNSGNITVTNNGFDITATDFTNSGTISANTTLNTTVSSTVSGSFDNTGGVLSADTVSLSVAGDFDYTNRGTITTTGFNLNVGGDFSNNDSANDFTWSAQNSLTVLGNASVVADSFSNSGNINANSFDITATDFTNSGTISANTTLNTTVSSTVSGSFTNTGGVLNATAFALSVAGDFDYVADYLNNGTITTNAFNLNVGGDFSNNDAANDLDWGANDTLTVLGNADITTDSFNNSGNINADNFNITATDFTNSGTISANTTLNTTVSSTVSGSFNNIEGVLNADTFNLSVAGDFDYVADFDGTITTNAFNLNVGGDFSNNDASSDFTWGANDSLTVLGSADITTNNFANDGNISADTFALSVAGDFDYTKKGTITTNSFNLNVGGDFSNNDAANDFVWNANDSLTVSGNADITTDSFNNSGNINADSFDITATDFTNSGTISANTTLNTTVSSTVSGSFDNTGGVLSADTVSLSVAGDFDYVADYLNNGTITNNSFNLNVGGDFSNNDLANDFTWGVNDALTVSGSASVVADSFNNSGNITVTNNGFDITATDFTNSGTISANTTLNTTVSSTVSGSFDNTGGVLSADTVSLSVAGDFDYVADYLNNGTITNNSFNLNVGGDFSNNDLANDFTWGVNDALTVSGSASVVADSFNNSGNITVTNNGFDITATDFTNSGTISANTTLNTTVSSTVSGSFNNIEGVLNADTFNLSVAGDFDYVADFNGTITTNALNLNVGGDFSNNDASSDFTWGANDSLTVLGNADITADSYTQNGAIDVAGVLTINVESDFDYVADFNGTIDFNSINLNVGGDFSNNDASSDFVWNANDSLTVLGSADITTNNFANDGNISADTFALSVAGDFDYVADYLNNGTITTNAFNLNVGGDFSNNDASNDFVWNAQNSLTVLGSASVVADSFSNSGIITVSNSGFDITATDFTNSGTISANTTLNTTVSSTESGSFNNTGGVVSADTVSLSVAGDFDYVADFNGTITTNALNLNVGGDFSNNDASSDFTWGANDSLTVLGSADITTNNFANDGNISADTFALSVAGDFDYTKKGTITTNTLNLNVGGDLSNNDASSDFTWGANDTLTVLGSASVVADSFNNSGTIAVSNSSFDITATDFTNSGTISANTTLNTTVSSTESGIFNNTGGVVSADTVSLSVAGDFDYVADYLNNGTITNNSFNLNVGGDFSNNDSANDFVWNAQNSLTVLGSASVVADSFSNSGIITVSNSGFDITATDFTNSGTISANTTLNTTVSSTESGSFNNTGGVVSADTVSLSVAGDFDYVADFDGTIGFNSINLNVGGDFSNNDSTNDFNWGANDILTVLGNADITADSYTQNGAIDVAGVLTINVESDFDYVADFNGTITTNSFNLNVGGDFSNNDASNDFVWNANYILTVSGNADITTDSFNNSGNINANSFNVTATDFTNSGTISANTTLNTTVSSTESGIFNNTGGVFSADTVSLSVAGDFDYTKKGTITTNALNLQVGGDFSYNDTNSNFSWHANNSLVVLGSASFNVDDFFNKGRIDVANDFNVIAGDDFYNTRNATIIANNFSVLLQDRFYNLLNSTIIANNFSVLTQSRFHNLLNSTISVNDFNVTAGSLFVSRYSANISAESFNVTAADNFYNTDNSTISADDLTISANSFGNNHTRGDGNIIANTLTLSLIGDFDYAKDFQNNGNIDATNQNFTISDGNFTNTANIVLEGNLGITADSYSQSGTIKVANLNIAVSTKANLDDTASIQSNTLFFSAYNLYNQADLTVTDSATFDIGNDFYNGFYLNGIHYGGDIIANNFNVTAGHYFFNDRRATINANNFNVTAGDYFYNWHGSTINADNFNVTAERFSNEINATISADNFNVETGTSFYNYSNATINANTFNVATRYDFYNYGRSTINANTFNVASRYDFYNYGRSTINANTFNVVTRYDFYNYNNSTINADNFSVTAGEEFYNYATIEADSLTISADSLVNSHSYWGDGNIIANELILILNSGF